MAVFVTPAIVLAERKLYLSIKLITCLQPALESGESRIALSSQMLLNGRLIRHYILVEHSFKHLVFTQSSPSK